MGKANIKSRCGLVYKQKKWWFRSQFDADRESFALFNIEAFPGYAHHRIGIVLHIEQLDHLINVSEFFGLRGSRRLS